MLHHTPLSLLSWEFRIGKQYESAASKNMSGITMWRRAGARMRRMKCPGWQSQGGTNSKEEPTVVGNLLCGSLGMVVRGFLILLLLGSKTHVFDLLGTHHYTMNLTQGICWNLDDGSPASPWVSKLHGVSYQSALGAAGNSMASDPDHTLLYCKGVHHHLMGFPGGQW